MTTPDEYNAPQISAKSDTEVMAQAAFSMLAGLIDTVGPQGVDCLVAQRFKSWAKILYDLSTEMRNQMVADLKQPAQPQAELN